MLDDRSLALVIREAKDEEHWRYCDSTTKERASLELCYILFTELTTLKKTDNESIVDYVIRAETALRNADEAVSDALLIAMVLKVLPSNFKNFK
jgi:hypothetical protein